MIFQDILSISLSNSLYSGSNLFKYVISFSEIYVTGNFENSDFNESVRFVTCINENLYTSEINSSKKFRYIFHFLNFKFFNFLSQHNAQFSTFCNLKFPAFFITSFFKAMFSLKFHQPVSNFMLYRKNSLSSLI